MWEKLTSERNSTSLAGITPTLVGNTRMIPGSANYTRDHPHTRGEYLNPHTATNLSVGITPTPVGNTDLIDNISAFSKDHPHTRGEY
nr:hypothetical protein [Levilactobacillus brevis]